MTDATWPAGAEGASATKSRRKATWAWHPQLPLQGVPVFAFPPQPMKILRYLVSVGFLWSLMIPLTLLAVVTWVYLQPPLAETASLAPGWILLMLARNLFYMVAVAGGLHLYFFTFKKQGTLHKFDARDLSRNDRKFFLRNQVWDNVYWTCVSGVSIWTAYEVLFVYGYANGWIPMITWQSEPVWFVAILLAIPFWNSVHFYFVHRLLHWRPLYKAAHALHHRNVNLGPWSGLSMHPIEHLLYLSSVLIHLVIPSHPIHIFFHMQFLTLYAATAHTGFQDLVIKGKTVFALAPFHHQLHHKYFDCNYGNEYVPCDRWFGSEHDGSPEAHARIKARRARLS